MVQSYKIQYCNIQYHNQNTDIDKSIHLIQLSPVLIVFILCVVCLYVYLFSYIFLMPVIHPLAQSAYRVVL